MIKQLKTFTVRMVAGANISTVGVMLFVGFADYFDPVSHPMPACLGLTFPIFLLINLCFLIFWLMFKRRMAIIPVAGYLLAYVPVRIYMPLNLPSDMPDDVIKVLSYNVQGYKGTPRYDGSFDKIFDYISWSGADIVCLQEDLGVNSAGKARLDSLYAYTDTTHVGSKSGINAVGLYSHYPILRKERIDYPSEGNGSVAYYLLVEGDTVLVINNHFESNHLSLDDRRIYKEMLKGDVRKDTAKAESKKLIFKLAEAVAQRGPQADSVHSYIERHRRYPMIVCGDFNDNPISYTRRTVAKGLTDCYVSTGRGIGLSYNQKGFFVRIDNLLCSEHFKPYNCKVDNKIDASDHYPVFCWLKKQDNHKK